MIKHSGGGYGYSCGCHYSYGCGHSYSYGDGDHSDGLGSGHGPGFNLDQPSIYDQENLHVTVLIIDGDPVTTAYQSHTLQTPRD